MAHAADKHSALDDQERNCTMLQAFEWYTPGGGTHWEWLASQAPRFASLGITAVWLPPATKGSGPDDVGYGISDLWDIGEFSRVEGEDPRTKYGTRAQLEAAMRELRKNGIACYMDAVLNHKLGANRTETFRVQQVDDNDRTKPIGEERDIEGWTGFDFPGRGGKYSDFKYNFNHFTGVDYDQKTGDKGVFRILGKNKSFADDVDQEKGGYDYLMGADVDHAHPDVAKDIIDWGKWMIRTFPMSGWRFDAVKHISREFIHDFVSAIRDEARKLREEQGKPKLDESEGPIMFGVGEFWADKTEACLEYLEKFGDEQFSLFDAPLHYNLVEAGNAGKDYDLRKVFDGTIVQARPIDAVTLVTNHDTQKGQALESVVAPDFMPLAYSIILFRQSGYPCIFLGDLDGCHSEDGASISTPPMSDLAKFLQVRRYFAFGEQRDYWDHPSCVGWTRGGSEQHDGMAVVLCVGEEEGKKWMEVGQRYKGTEWVDAIGWLGEGASVKVNDEGWAEFRSPAHSVGVWVPKDAKLRSEIGK
ncbi:thermostable alpha-amylase [Jaminaea rosea]|uniref:Thermostable alpha-amylase n=1 Tax=Jaminaea rosea TaxID=1569628 RepID=A0A316UH07_9BASI|nr:thermostable alpha-amylase [Jaminaea rosea]PWN24529.1 thermostable alpha-amylase [Jaminaea rosea]